MNHQVGIANPRRIAAVVFALIMALGFTATFAGQADANKRNKPVRVGVQIVTQNQAALLNSNRLVVRVRATGRTRARVAAVSGGRANLFQRRNVRFNRKGGVRRVVLPMTRAGRNVLSRCGAKVVRANVIFKRGKRNARATRQKRLARSPRQCAAPTPPAPQVSLEKAADQGSPTNEPAIRFTLSSNLDLNASTVDASDFAATNASITDVAGSGTSFTVTVNAAANGNVTIAPSAGFSVSSTAGAEQTTVGGTDRTVEYDTNWRHVPLGANPERCDFLDQTVCLHPWPNDYYTVDDGATDSGKRLNINPQSTPANTAGVHIDVTDINRGDGFSPGNKIVFKAPGVDTPAAFANTGFVGLADLDEYADPDQPVLLIDAETGERQLIWAELDSNPTTVDPSTSGPGGIGLNPTNTDPVNIIVRPAKNLEHGKRYIIAFRDLKDGNDQPVPAPVGFQVYRDNLRTTQDIVEDRRPHMESIIDTLVDEADVDRSSLYMAWDFTVASQESVTGRALTIRDDAFARLGDNDLADRKIAGSTPDVDVLAYCDVAPLPENSCGNNYPGINEYNPELPASSPSPSAANEQRTVVGYIRDVPCYLSSDGCTPGGTFEFDANGELTWDVSNTMDVPFRCIIPRSTVSGGTVIPGGTGTYGHGLLGTLNQINATRAVANGTNSTFCAANWDGFSTLDLSTIIASLGNMSNFNKAVDRMQQGFVNFMMVQRAMAHEDGFAEEEAFQMSHDGTDPVSNPGTPAIDVSAGEDTRGYYMGISQGGIMGGALTPLSPDVDRGALGVTGMNYSTLLRRSVDSDQYFKLPGLGLYANYPNEASRPLLLSLMQLLWDRGEGNGYAHFMTDNPLPNTNPHQVYMDMALGDHQVSNFTADVEARTNGALRYSPTLVPSRHNWDINYTALPDVSTFPTPPGSSVMVYYDSGPPTFTGPRGIGAGINPLENVPPRPEWGFGRDPHGDPRASADGQQHAIEFLGTGQITECADPSGLCFANGWDGTSGL